MGDGDASALPASSQRAERIGADMQRALCLVAFLIFVFAPGTALAYGNCTDADYMRLIDARLPTGRCDIIDDTTEIHWGGHVAHIRSIKLHGVSMPRSADFIARVRETARRVGTAMELMGDVDIDNVTLFFTNYESPLSEPQEPLDKGPYDAAAARGDAECPISIYKRDTDGMSEREFVFIIAHELFHCIQYKTWGAMPRDRWLVEGSAEYFANLAMPYVHASDGYVSEFDDRIAGLALYDMSYPAVVFFSWLGQERRAAGVGDFLAAYRGAMAANVTPDMWGEFAKAYYGRTIRLPGGRELPSTPRLGDVTRISGDMHFPESPITPYTLFGAPYTFTPHKSYTLTYAPRGPDIREFWRSFAGGDWEAPRTSVSACDNDVSYLVILGSTNSVRAGAFDVRADERSCERRRERPGGGGGSDGSDYGEPHLVTFDGYEYSFQNVGEFVLTRASDGFEIQTRQEQVPGLVNGAEVAANTAVAIRVNTHRVALYAHAFRGVPIDRSRLYVDGVPTNVDNDELRLGDAVIRARGDNAFDITLTNGAHVGVDFFTLGDFKYLDLSIHVPAAAPGTYTGLLGDADGDPHNDLRIQGGGVVPQDRSAYDHATGAIGAVASIPLPLDQIATAYYDHLARTFGDSWRISPSASLFDYGPGQSTANFTNRAFPRSYATLSTLDPQAVADATAACQSAHVPDARMNGCTFDVAVSGQHGFADAAGQIASEVRRRVEDEVRRRLPDIPLPVPVPHF